jgi:hypothetical protein
VFVYVVSRELGESLADPGRYSITVLFLKRLVCRTNCAVSSTPIPPRIGLVHVEVLQDIEISGQEANPEVTRDADAGAQFYL